MVVPPVERGHGHKLLNECLHSMPVSVPTHRLDARATAARTRARATQRMRSERTRRCVSLAQGELRFTHARPVGPSNCTTWVANYFEPIPSGCDAGAIPPVEKQRLEIGRARSRV